MENMFEKGLRSKVRFNYRGMCTIEDLYDLTRSNLNGIFVALKKQQNDKQAESLLNKKTKEDELLDLKIAIVKHVFEVKSQEMEERRQAAQKAALKQKLLGIKADRQDAALDKLSDEDLNKMISEL